MFYTVEYRRFSEAFDNFNMLKHEKKQKYKWFYKNQQLLFRTMISTISVKWFKNGLTIAHFFIICNCFPAKVSF